MTLSNDFSVGDPDLHNGTVNLWANTHEISVQSHITEMQENHCKGQRVC